jgi:hypothetical protein
MAFLTAPNANAQSYKFVSLLSSLMSHSNKALGLVKTSLIVLPITLTLLLVRALEHT